jgi:hypothetical protein
MLLLRYTTEEDGMRAVTGTFQSLTDGRRAAERVAAVVGADHINLLTPESPRSEVKTVPTTEDMRDVGAPMGAAVGAALGIGTAVMIPGLGAVTALGVAAAALFGAAGGILGWKAGDAADRTLSGGLPADEVYFYEDALRQGRTVLVALVDDPAKEGAVRDLLAACGTETIDAARERWWMGIRDAEAEHFAKGERDDGYEFAKHERLYRYGFVAGVTGGARRPEELDLWPYLDRHEQSAVQRGYERGVQSRRSDRSVAAA